MQRGSIPDNKITSSSTLNASTPARNGRLNYTEGSSWCVSTNDSNPYLQIDLQSLHIICAVSTQGNSKADEWVEIYTIQTSTDGLIWTDYESTERLKVPTNLRKFEMFYKRITSLNYEIFLPPMGKSNKLNNICSDTDITLAFERN